MKKLNKKGFTLIELLAVIIILGVLLLIAVPSVSKYITQSRQKTYATNLSKMVDVVSAEVNSYNEGFTFAANQYLVVPVVCVELDRGNATKSPFGVSFDTTKTYILVRREGNSFKYDIAALDLNGYGTNLVSFEELAKTEELKITELGSSNQIAPITENTTTVDGKEVTTYKLTLTKPDYYANKEAVVVQGKTCPNLAELYDTQYK